MFWPYEGGHHDTYKRLHIGFHGRCLHEWYDQRNGFPLPFRSGDLVRLDPPVFDEPEYGVLYVFHDLNSTRYMWLYYIQDSVLHHCSMSYHSIGGWSPWRVIDWTHPAMASELPPGQEILKELSRAFREAGQDTPEAEDFHSDIFDRSPAPVFRRMPITLSELLDQKPPVANSPEN